MIYIIKQIKNIQVIFFSWYKIQQQIKPNKQRVFLHLYGSASKIYIYRFRFKTKIKVQNKISLIIFCMDISLSKFRKKNLFLSNDRSQCNLFNFSVAQQTIIYQRKPSACKKSVSRSDHHVSGIALTSRKQHKYCKQQDHQTRCNSIQKSNKFISSTSIKTINPRLLVNLDNNQIKSTNIKQLQNNQKQKYKQIYHGSWGIPRYQAATPIKQTKKQILSIYNQSSNMSNTRQLRTPIKSQNMNNSNFIKVVFSTKISLQTKESFQTQQKYAKQSKIDSTRVSRSQQQIWHSSVKQMQPTSQNSLMPKMAHTKNQLSSIRSQAIIPAKSISQSSRAEYSSSLTPMLNLQQAREAKSVVSGDLSRAQSLQIDQQKFSHAGEPLKQSIVLATNIHQSGFWN